MGVAEAQGSSSAQGSGARGAAGGACASAPRLRFNKGAASVGAGAGRGPAEAGALCIGRFVPASSATNARNAVKACERAGRRSTSSPGDSPLSRKRSAATARKREPKAERSGALLPDAQENLNKFANRAASPGADTGNVSCAGSPNRGRRCASAKRSSARSKAGGVRTVKVLLAAAVAGAHTTKTTQVRGLSTKYGKTATGGKLCLLLPAPGTKRGSVKLTLRLGTSQGG